MLKQIPGFTVVFVSFGLYLFLCTVYLAEQHLIFEQRLQGEAVAIARNGTGEMEYDTSEEANTKRNSSRPKIILFWSPFAYTRSITNDLNNCPVGNCQVTNDRRLLSASDVVIFQFWNEPFDGLPTNRKENQFYIYYNFESPIRSREYYPWGKIPGHFFNLTATYRLDSDLFGKTFYGLQFERRKNTFVRKQAKNLNNYYGINIKSKRKKAAWFVSNCKTTINREGYVRELQKHMTIDVFGQCLENNKSCPRDTERECDKMLQRDYMFYLSFENSFCPDYVTEKFYRAFNSGTIPVVFGGANYSLFAPPHSYINARDFKNPQLLAKFLTKVSKNSKLYSSYFDWRRDFQLKYNSGWCKLCEMLHEPNRARKSYENIENWFFEKNSCENYHWTRKIKS